MDARPPIDVPADRAPDETQVMAPVRPGSDDVAPLVQHVPPLAAQVIDPDDLARPWDPTWRKGDPATSRRGPTDPASPVRGVALGVPSPDSVFLDPSKIDFADWAADWLAEHAPKVHAKAQEYGSNSLVQQGRRYARGQDRDVGGVEAMEIGCWVYAGGKMDRVEDAIQRQDLPGRDSWHDIAVYALMVLYMRSVGRWP